jgi:hypothetical protein
MPHTRVSTGVEIECESFDPSRAPAIVENAQRAAG